MKLLDKIQRDIDEIAEFGFCNYAETFITLIEARERIEELELAQKGQRICKKCGKHVANEEEYKLFCGCSGCASTLD